MKIAVAGSDYLKVTGHAGQARRRLVFEAEPGRPPVEIDRIEPPKDLVFHHWSGEGTHPLDGVQAVIARSAGEGLKFFRKLAPCLVGMEACASAHHWAREIAALGHDVRLLPPTRVKPYVKRGRNNDQVDAAACYEAVTRPSMQSVARPNHVIRLQLFPEQA